jgi:hypothetical protein
MYKLRFAKSGLRAAMIGAALMTTTSMVSAEETIKVGILHSLSGTMAISETTLKDVMLMLIEEQNKKGGTSWQEARSCGCGPGFRLAACLLKRPAS